GTSFDERLAACGGDYLSVFGVKAVDWRLLAQCLRGRPLCHSPIARGISRLGSRTERRTQWRVLYADPVGLCALCPQQSTFFRAICDVIGALRIGFDV